MRSGVSDCPCPKSLGMKHRRKVKTNVEIERRMETDGWTDGFRYCIIVEIVCCAFATTKTSATTTTSATTKTSATTIMYVK